MISLNAADIALPRSISLHIALYYCILPAVGFYIAIVFIILLLLFYISVSHRLVLFYFIVAAQYFDHHSS